MSQQVTPSAHAFQKVWSSLRSEKAALLAIFALALMLRLATLANPSSYFPDQVFQHLEVAHDRIFGYGIETWEQRYGIRSPLFPLFLAIPMQIGKWISADGFAFLFAAKTSLALCSLAIIWGSYRIGRILSRVHGLFAAFAAAIWFEFIYFSTQALTDSFALACFFPAAGLLLDRKRATRGSLFCGGMLLALAAIFRFQYGPALLLFGLLACGRTKWRWLWAGGGAFAAAILSGLVDLSQGMTPFSWLVGNFYHNIILSRSHLYSISGPTYYLTAIAALAGLTVGAQLVLSWFGARVFPTLAATAIVNIAVHSMIAHKEYRFILLSTAILALLAAIGTVELIFARKALGGRPTILLMLAAGLWTTGSALNATFGSSSAIWSYSRTELRLFQALHEDKAACGIALYNTDWSSTGAYTYLHRNVPLYIVESFTAPVKWPSVTPAFNRIIASPQDTDLPRQYRLHQCKGGREPNAKLCIYQRQGGCNLQAAEKNEFNTWLRRKDL
jgi:hypothetical protein